MTVLSTDLSNGQTTRRRRLMGAAVLAMLLGSAACVAIAPLLMPDSYSIVEHSISESAAQRVDGVWLARTGLLLLGFSVLVLAGLSSDRWGVWGRVAHRVYGVSAIAAATFAHMPFEDVPFDEFEDFLHSVASFGVGFSFTIGVLVVTFRRDRTERLARVFDWVAIVAALVLPMLIFNVTGIAGLVQRVLFAIGYVWYASETIRMTRMAQREVVDRAVHETAAVAAGQS